MSTNQLVLFKSQCLYLHLYQIYICRNFQKVRKRTERFGNASGSHSCDHAESTNDHAKERIQMKMSVRRT